MGEGSNKTLGERNWYENAAVPAAAMLSDPSPSLAKKARRLNRCLARRVFRVRSGGVIFFSSGILTSGPQ